jgi:LytS/YehU family sensor histidine kinase
MVRAQTGGLDAHTVTGYVLFFGYAIVFTHGLRAVIRRRGWLARPPARAVMPLAVSALALGVLLTGCVVLVTVLQRGADSVFRQPGALTGLAINLTFAAALWTLLYVSLSTWLHHRQERQQAEALERSLNAARLKALEAQISPHFLFNCLNSLRGMIAEDTTRAQDMVTRLANILRHNLTQGTESTREPLGAQVDVIRDYLELEAVRFDERLRTTITLDPAAANQLVPAMLLQTLVENAIKHGIAHLPEGGDVAVRAQHAGDELVIAVENTGTLRPPAAGSTGVGLGNLRERLRLLHGPAATCELRAVSPDRVRAEVRVPWPATNPVS